MNTLNISVPMKLIANTVLCSGRVLAAVFLSLLFFTNTYAMPLSGTRISNQASANYIDSGTNRAALLTSNIVEAIVQQVSAFTLTASQSRTVSPGSIYYLPHQIINTGNGTDNFNLAVTVLAGALTNVSIYADTNADGLPDNQTAIVNTGNIAPGAAFNVVVAVTIPAASAPGTSGQLTITATGMATLNPAPAQVNTDTLIVSPQAVLSVTKSFSVASGPSPNNNGGAHIAVTLAFANNGNAAASNIQFSDVIGGINAAPAYNSSGMTYFPGSGIWNGQALTDAPGLDPPGISYAATTIAGVTTISGTLTSLAAGSTAQITFLVDVLPGLPLGSGLTSNIVHVIYSDGLAQQAINSNVATYNVLTTVIPSPDLVISKTHTPVSFTVGIPGTFNLVVSNIGAVATSGMVTVSDPLPAGLAFDQAASGGTGWTCNAAGQNVVCSSAAVIPAGAAGPNIAIAVVPQATLFPPPPAVQLNTVTLTNTAHVAGGGELAVNSYNNDSLADTVIVGPSASVSGHVWLDANHNRILDAGEVLISGIQAELLNSAGVLIATALTDVNGVYNIGPVVPGVGFRLRFRDPVSGALFTSPVNGEKGAPTSTAVTNFNTGEIQNLTLLPRANIIEQSLPLDPSGVVYDSFSRTPVIGATVTIVGPAGFNPVLHLLGGAANVAQKVGPLGYYQFLLLAGAPAGNYKLQVTAPAGYVSPSALIPAQPVVFMPPAGIGRYQVQTQPFPPAVGSPTTYYLSLNLAPGLMDIVNNHIPLDPILTPGSGLLVSKVASRTTAEPGDFIDYTVTVKNATTVILPATKLQDILPLGFRYVPGSTKLNSVAQPDPLGGAGPALTFTVGALAPNTVVTLTYRLAVGMAATLGNGVNRAQAISGAARSNIATATVQITQGVFSDRAYILGTVYLDCNRNHVQDAEEPGIPSVRLYLEDGTNVTTDMDGKYSLYGINPLTHVLKLDDTTMPVGAVLETLANRNAGVAGSRFVDLKNGELHRADFASPTCTKEVLSEVKLRHDKSKDNETDRALNYKLNPLAIIAPVADSRALPASGELEASPTAKPESYQPVLKDSGLNSANSNLPGKPVSSVPVIDLEKLLVDTDNSLDFIDLKDNDTLPMAQTSVRIKGPIGSIFRLRVNEQDIGLERVGRKSSLADKQLEAWEYIGITLKSGKNILAIRQMDQFGNERGTRSITLIAPDQMAHIVIDAPKTIEADGHSTINVRIRLVDEQGVTVTSRTYLTLESTLGRWQTKDLDSKEPGVQVVMEGGTAEFALMAPSQPGEENLRITSGIIKVEHQISYLPELRPMIAAGMIEGALNMHSLNAGKLVPVTVNDSFEQQIKRISAGDRQNNVSERAALFLKGKVKGEYLLTLAYDSEKNTRERLFRDIQPDEFYPVYGDSSIKGYDAQSTSRLYVRVDKGKSYLLYGDYLTQSTVPARSLSQYNRSLNGIKEHFENDKLMVNAFASQDTSRQVIQEIPANGTSGPFQLTNNGALINSEKIEILTRDRNQPSLILLIEPQTRFADYEVEQYAGRILFKSPIPSLDANLNPKYIRVTFELDQGGKTFLISGVDAQFKLTDQLEIGGVLTHDGNPMQTATLTGANASLKLTEKTVMVGELAHTGSVSGKGNAKRLELRHEGSSFLGRIYAARSDVLFDNASSTLSKGRQESGAKGSYKLNDTTSLNGEMIKSKDVLSGSNRNGILLAMEKSLSDSWRVEAGMRDTSETVAGLAAMHTTTARVKTTAQFAGVKGLSVNGEYEQDVRNSGKRVAAIGAEYQMMSRGKLYARHEFISSLSSPFALNPTQNSNTTVIGVDTDYTPDTHLFSEYRQRGVMDGREAEAALGLRNKWQLDEGLRLNTSAERIVNIAGGAGRSAQAYTGAIEYTADPLWKGSTRLEYRNADSSSGWLNSIDAARKLSDSWTVIGKEVFSENKTKGAAPGVSIQQRVQAGLAWRNMKKHDWNALSKFEHRRESDTTVASNINRKVDIFSTHANYQPESHWQASARYAGKWVTEQSLGLSNRSNMHLVSGRLMWDVTERLDAGINVSMMGDRNFRSIRYGLGGELGYLLTENLWVSIGLNIFGFSEPDMLAQSNTDKGLFLRLRFKFDEDMFGGILEKFDEKEKK